MKKNLYFIAAAIFLVVALPLVIPAFTTFSAPRAVTVIVDGQTISFQGQEPVIVDNRTLVPIRGVFEKMGFDVHWDYDNRIARLSNAEYTIFIPADIPRIVINYEIIIPDVPHRMMGNRMMIPLRLVTELVGWSAHWDSDRRMAIIIPPGEASVGSDSDGTHAFMRPPNFDGPSLIRPTPHPPFSPLPTGWVDPWPNPWPSPSPLFPWPTHPVIPGMPTPGPWPTDPPVPGVPAPTVPPIPTESIHNFSFGGARHSVFVVEFFKVVEGDIVSVSVQTYGAMESVYSVWAELNNVSGAEFINSYIAVFPDIWPGNPESGRPYFGGTSRAVGINLSPGFNYYLESENGQLLAQSLAYTYKHMWRPIIGNIQFALVICEESIDHFRFPNRPEDALFFSEIFVTRDDYPYGPSLCPISPIPTQTPWPGTSWPSPSPPFGWDYYFPSQTFNPSVHPTPWPVSTTWATPPPPQVHTPWPTWSPHFPPSQPILPPLAHLPYPPRTINDYMLWNLQTYNSIFDIEIFWVENNEIVSEVMQVYGNAEAVFSIWAERNNLYNVELLNSGLWFTRDSGLTGSGRPFIGSTRAVSLRLSPEYYYYRYSENGSLLDISLSQTFTNMWRPIEGNTYFALASTGHRLPLFPLEVWGPQEGLYVLGIGTVTEYCYPH